MKDVWELLINRQYQSPQQLKPWYALIFIAYALPLVWGLSWLLLRLPWISDKMNSGDSSMIFFTVQAPLIILGIIFILATHMKWRDLKLRAPSFIQVALAVGVVVFGFIGAIMIAMVVYTIQEAIAPGTLEKTLKEMEVLQGFILASNFAKYLRVIFFLAILTAIVEEFIYRGLIMDSLMKLGPTWAIIISGIVFGLSHGVLLRIPSMIFVGCLFGWLKYRTGNLGASMLAHFVYNSLVVTIAVLAQDFMGDSLKYI